jgi:hypothetical protein
MNPTSLPNMLFEDFVGSMIQNRGRAIGEPPAKIVPAVTILLPTAISIPKAAEYLSIYISLTNKANVE